VRGLLGKIYPTSIGDEVRVWSHHGRSLMDAVRDG
jgi:hypothetical protein